MPQSLDINDAGNGLHEDDHRQLLAHSERLLSLTSRSDLVDCLDAVRAWLDVSEIVVATGHIADLSHACVVGSGYDEQWMELYFDEQFALVDPIVRGILDGRALVNRDVVTPGTPAAACRPKGPTLARFAEAARDYRRPHYGCASGVVFNDHLALCSAVTVAPWHGQRLPRVLRTLRPILYHALTRVLLPGPTACPLSLREQAILECLADGQNDIQIADTLSISVSTVRFHLGNVFEKLGARNRCHAVAIGFQSGLLSA